jgi:hypothetical protein
MGSGMALAGPHGADQAGLEATQMQVCHDRRMGSGGVSDGAAVGEAECGHRVAVHLGQQDGAVGRRAACQGSQPTEGVAVGVVGQRQPHGHGRVRRELP